MKTFYFDGKPYAAEANDTIASALYRSGVRVFSRSFKYHRPRGLLCAAGKCPNCLVDVDGTPNVRACTQQVCSGDVVTHQNASPSLKHDMLSVAGLVDWLMPIGFYYKTFTHPAAWKLVEPWIRRAAGLGVVKHPVLRNYDDVVEATKGYRYEHVNLHAEKAIVGGGPAGMLEALKAAGEGLDVVLVDDQPELGGNLRYRKKVQNPQGNPLDAQKLREQIAATPNIRVLNNTSCFGLYEGNLLGMLHKTRRGGDHVEQLIKLRAGQITVATGCFEVPLVFKNNDLPGIMLSTAVQRLLNQHRIKVAESAVVVSAEEDGGEVAADMKHAGVSIAAVVHPSEVVAANGRGQVRAIQTSDKTIPCELIVICGLMLPEAGLLSQGGAVVVWDADLDSYAPQSLPSGLSVVGDATGKAFTIPRVTHSSDLLPKEGLDSGRPKSFVCYCEDVTSKDLCNGIEEGFDHIQTLKRYSTATMGPCQGKMCHLATAAVRSKVKGETLAETGRTTSRPPNPSVSLGALAGRKLHTLRRTPLHRKHEEHDVVWVELGHWKRARYYKAGPDEKSEKEYVQEEYRNVRDKVGLIDVSTLGKLEVKGADAGSLLDKIYTNKLSTLREGRMRYSVICDDTATILDDGTVSRLAEDHFFITTTTGNIDFVQQWMEWWKAGTDWSVHITNVTGGFGAINVAGPHARDVLSQLTDCDLNTEAFPYMACREAVVAEIPCRLLRIGFTGETGWEIHFPAECGEHLWDAVMQAGEAFGIRPFGVEAQRTLRLEKMHVIVSADTDATSNPYGAELEFAVKLDKEDFIGKPALMRLNNSALHEKLIGFEMQTSTVPGEGAMLVHEGRPAGRVTSSRHSAVKGKPIGLAWIAAELAQQGRAIDIQSDGHTLKAVLTTEVFYDPEGSRVRT